MKPEGRMAFITGASLHPRRRQVKAALVPFAPPMITASAVGVTASAGTGRA